MAKKSFYYYTFFQFLKDSIKWSKNQNLLLLWYEDMLINFEEKVNEISKFTGFDLSPEQMKVRNLTDSNFYLLYSLKYTLSSFMTNLIGM